MTSSARQAFACILAIVSVAAVAHAQTGAAKEPTVTISGRVTIKEKGIAGVNVVVRRSDSSSSARRREGTYKAVTDEDGKYRITNVVPGEYRVLPVALAYVPADESERERVLFVGKSENVENVNFALVRGGVITGKVVDSDGRPIVEEPVYVITGADNRTYYGQYNSNTDDRGVYRIYGLRPGSYKVAAGRGDNAFMHAAVRTFKQTFYPSAPDAAQATIVEVSEGSETRDIDIVFSRTLTTYTARGRVVDGETGQPIPSVGYGITRYEQGGSSSRGWGAVTNARGEFRVDNLSPGTYAISIAAPQNTDWRVEEMRFDIVDHDVTDVVLKTIRSATISGVIVLEGVDDKTAKEQLSRMMIMGYVDGRPSQSQGAASSVNADGSFQIRGLAGGTILFHVHSNASVRVDRLERDGMVQPRGIVVKEREQVKGVRVVMQFGNASLRGKIDVANGTLPADARFHVWARRIGEEPSMYSGNHGRPQVDARGQFVIEGLTPGNYEIDAGVYFPSAKVGYIAKKQVVVTAGATTDVDVTVDLNSTPIRQP